MESIDGSPATIYGGFGDELLASLTGAYNRVVEKGIDFEEFISPVVEEAARKAGTGLATELKRRAPRMLREHGRIRRRFERHLRKEYRRALDLYYQVYVCAQEFGSDFDRVHRSGAAADRDFKFEALTTIHARACLVASEIHALLRTGHPFGALARWRTLHECAVVASIIGDNDQELAERYLLHTHVESHRDSVHFAAAHEALGQPPLSPSEVDEIRRERDAVVARFGLDFDQDWGWASRLMPSGKRPTFKRLEELAGIAHLRPYYRWSSHNVHGGPKGGYLNRFEVHGSATLLTGPTNLGLVEPAHAALISMTLITCILAINGRPEAVELMTTPVLVAVLELTEEAGEAFAEAEERIEARARRLGQLPTRNSRRNSQQDESST